MGGMARSPKIISDFDRKLGGAIKHRRRDPELEMSQAELAKASGIPLSNLQRREEGDNEVTVSELERIAAALKTTPLALVEVALARYGGLEKLIAEHTFKQVSEDARSVSPADDIPYIGKVVPPLSAAADDDPRTGPKD